MELQELIKQLQALIDEAKALGDSEADNARYTELEQQIKAKRAEIETANTAQKSAEERALRLKEADDFVNQTATRMPFQVKGGGAPTGDQRVEHDAGDSAVHVRNARVKYFKASRDAKGRVKSAEQNAFEFGLWFLSAVAKQDWATARCKALGLDFRTKTAQTEGINGDGGATVPTEFSNTIIDLREEYGVFRGEVMVEPMKSDNQIIPRAKGGLRAYPVGEGVAGTRSKTAWDNVELTARKWMVLARYSTEVNEDSIIAWADRLAYEIAYAMAVSEDEAGFIGDGTSAYHRITGVIPKLLAVDATPANVKGLVTATGNDWGEIILQDFLKCKGRLARYARRDGGPKWFCSATFHAEVMESLALAAGGNTAAEIVNGASQPRFLGFPVVYSEAMPIEDPSTAHVPCMLANLRQAVTMGDRRGLTMALSEHSSFDEDMVDIKGTERFDINVHDVGDTAKAGPVVGLYLPA